METQRLFIAFDLTAETIAKITGFQRVLMKDLPGSPIRWTPGGSMHVTLQFLGEVEQSKLAKIKSAMDNAVKGVPSLSMFVQGFGAFPSPLKAQVIWLGINANLQLSALVKKLGRELSPLGFAPNHHFAPHITLGRVRDYASAADIALIADVIERHKNIAIGTDVVSEIRLYKSTLQRGGSLYQLLHRAGLENIMLH